MSDQSESRLKPEFLAARLLAYGEEERRRVARELHDDIGQRLALLADDADRLRREIVFADEDKHRRRLDNLVEQARSLAEDLRNISHTLHPAILDDLGLEVALRSLTRHFSERTGLSASFAGIDVPREIPVELGTALYRITQEALRNISKYAGKTSLRVTLDGSGNLLTLMISDLGRGFDPKTTTGLGLTTMRERAYLAGGSFMVASTPGKGTTVQVQIPCAVPKSN